MSKTSKMSSMCKCFARYVWSWKMHQTSPRKSHVSVDGIKRNWEVTPIVGLVLGSWAAEVYFFAFYFWNTRTDVNYKLWPPLYETLNLGRPKQCKFLKGASYLTYQRLDDLEDVLTDMYCAEKSRKRKLAKIAAKKKECAEEECNPPNK